MAAWTSPSSRSSTCSSASCARSSRTRRRARTTSRRSGAAAMCCASPSRWKSASPPDPLRRALFGLSPPDFGSFRTPPVMAGFLFGGQLSALLRAPLCGFLCLFLLGCRFLRRVFLCSFLLGLLRDLLCFLFGRFL